ARSGAHGRLARGAFHRSRLHGGPNRRDRRDAHRLRRRGGHRDRGAERRAVRPAGRLRGPPTMKLKAIGTLVGALLVLVGATIGAGGVGVLATIGTDGKVSTGQQSFDTSGAALVTSAADLRKPEKVADIVGDPRVQMDVSSDKPVFVGVGPAA